MLYYSLNITNSFVIFLFEFTVGAYIKSYNITKTMLSTHCHQLNSIKNHILVISASAVIKIERHVTVKSP